MRSGRPNPTMHGEEGSMVRRALTRLSSSPGGSRMLRRKRNTRMRPKVLELASKLSSGPDYPGSAAALVRTPRQVHSNRTRTDSTEVGPRTQRVFVTDGGVRLTAPNASTAGAPQPSIQPSTGRETPGSQPPTSFPRAYLNPPYSPGPVRLLQQIAPRASPLLRSASPRQLSNPAGVVRPLAVSSQARSVRRQRAEAAREGTTYAENAWQSFGSSTRSLAPITARVTGATPGAVLQAQPQTDVLNETYPPELLAPLGPPHQGPSAGVRRAQHSPTNIGTIHLDGHTLGQWITQHLEETLSHANRGPSGVDPRVFPVWGPMSAAY